MRGEDRSSGGLFGHVDLEERVPVGHPLRVIRGIVNEVLSGLSCEFEQLHSPMGRPSVPPERLLRALPLQAFHSIRPERRLMERLAFDMLFGWFAGLGLDDVAWDAGTLCHDRDRLLEADVSGLLLSGVVGHRKVRRLLGRGHFSVDGTLIGALPSMRSFRARDGRDGALPAGRDGERDLHDERRSEERRGSTGGPQARLHRRGNGREGRLCFMGHALMEKRDGLVVGGGVTPASGTAERAAALDLLDRHRPRQASSAGGRGGGRRITLGSGKACQGLRRRGPSRSPGDAAHGGPGPPRQDRRAAAHQDRRPHEATCGPSGQPALPQAHRGGVRPGQDPLVRATQGGGLLPPGARRLQPRATAQAAGAGGAMTPEVACAIVGKRRIVEADLRDRDHLELVEPASITSEGDGHGEFAFGRVQGGLDRECSRRIIFLTWQGFDEMDQAGGDGAAELDDDGSLEIEFRCHPRDKAILKARK